jgi:hypothetical protein
VIKAEYQRRGFVAELRTARAEWQKITDAAREGERDSVPQNLSACSLSRAHALLSRFGHRTLRSRLNKLLHHVCPHYLLTDGAFF